jgi:acyl dehydratase
MNAHGVVDWRHLRPGDALPEVVRGPVERAQLVMYAGASGDFNRIHYDDGFAREGGFPSVIAHGMLSMAFLGQVLTRWVGAGAVRRFKVRFRAVTLPGDTVTCRGEVLSLAAEAGRHLAEVRLWAETRPGQVTVEGTATVALPR